MSVIRRADTLHQLENKRAGEEDTFGDDRDGCLRERMLRARARLTKGLKGLPVGRRQNLYTLATEYYNINCTREDDRDGEHKVARGKRRLMKVCVCVQRLKERERGTISASST